MMILPPMLPRGKGPLVSVLLPTRRHQNLLEAVHSLLSKANNPDNVEILLKTDEGDVLSIRAANHLASQRQNISNTTTPRGEGYAHIHHFINLLASHASGDWLMLFNDGARIMTDKELVLRFSCRVNATAFSPLFCK